MDQQNAGSGLTLAFTGVHLDRAWLELGSAFGNALREWSTEVLALAVQAAMEHAATDLVIRGNLFDRATVLPATVEYAATVLGSFPGRVLIVPGSHDRAGDDGPYELGAWAENTHIVTDSDLGPAVARLPLTDLVGAPDAETGWALLVDPSRPDEAPARIHVGASPGRVVDLDVTNLDEPAAFAKALNTAGGGDQPVMLRLSGHLQPRILLPGFGGPELPPSTTLDLSLLQYATETPDSADRGAFAEFLRAMQGAGGDDRERHQTTALGLAALDATRAGA